VLTPVAVEKLTHRKIDENTLQQEALRTTISVLQDILYVPNSTLLTKCFSIAMPGNKRAGVSRSGSCRNPHPECNLVHLGALPKREHRPVCRWTLIRANKVPCSPDGTPRTDVFIVKLE
jgi:hypothetical protein